MPPRFTQRRKRVRRFARLADDDHQLPAYYDGLSVAEFRRDLNFYGYARQILDQVFAQHARMERRTACDDVDLLHAAKKLFADSALLKIDASVDDPWKNGVCQSARFFVNLFDHKMRMPALFSLGGIPADMITLTVYRLAVFISNVHSILRQHGDLFVLQKMTSRVYSSSAGISDAMKFSPAPAQRSAGCPCAWQ